MRNSGWWLSEFKKIQNSKHKNKETQMQKYKFRASQRVLQILENSKLGVINKTHNLGKYEKWVWNFMKQNWG